MEAARLAGLTDLYGDGVDRGVVSARECVNASGFLAIDRSASTRSTLDDTLDTSINESSIESPIDATRRVPPRGACGRPSSSAHGCWLAWVPSSPVAAAGAQCCLPAALCVCVAVDLLIRIAAFRCHIVARRSKPRGFVSVAAGARPFKTTAAWGWLGLRRWWPSGGAAPEKVSTGSIDRSIQNLSWGDLLETSPPRADVPSLSALSRQMSRSL